MSRRSTGTLVLVMFGVAMLIDLRLLLEGVPSPSLQTTVGELIAGILLCFGGLGLALRLLEDENKKKRTAGIVVLVLFFIAISFFGGTYLSLH